MKRFFCFILLPFLSLAGVIYLLSLLHAQSPEPHSIIEKAIEAHGGVKNISKNRMGMMEGKTEGKEIEITQEETFDLPKRWKRKTSATLEGKRRISFDVMIGAKLWQWNEGEKPQQVPNDANAQAYFSTLSILLDLSQEKVKLSPLQKTKVNGESAVGLRATWDNSGSDYYFNEKSGLLVESRFTFQPEPGKDFHTKTVFSDYKEHDGVKIPCRRTTYVKGKEFNDFVLLTDFVVTEVTILDTVPDEVFAFPDKR